VGWIGPQHAPLNSTTHRSDWDIDPINSHNFKGSVQSDWDIDPGLHNTTKTQNLSSPPKGYSNGYSYIFSFFFFDSKQRKGRTGKKEKERSTPR
jgi:hypothetical protein